MFPRLNSFARIPGCGLVADYNATDLPEGPDRLGLLMSVVLRKSLTIRGFIQTEFAGEQMPAFLEQMPQWIAQDRVRYLEDVVEGFDGTIEAFRGLLVGKNLGKLVVHVAD